MRVGKKLVVPVVAGAAFTAGRRGRKAREAVVEPNRQGSTPKGRDPQHEQPQGTPSPAALPGVDADTPLEIPPPAGSRSSAARSRRTRTTTSRCSPLASPSTSSWRCSPLSSPR